MQHNAAHCNTLQHTASHHFALKSAGHVFFPQKLNHTINLGVTLALLGLCFRKYILHTCMIICMYVFIFNYMIYFRITLAF